MKKSTLKLLSSILLFSITTSSYAAPALGEWVATLWDDRSSASYTWSICIQSGGDWYISSTHKGWKGKWFSKGNDTHLQAIHSSGMAANSFDVSRVSDSLLAGYYKNINNVTGTSGYFTTSLVFKSAACLPYAP